MLFDELNELIPYCLGKKLHVMTMPIANAVQLSMPGRHQKETEIPGGDGVITVSDTSVGWVNHPFQHNDLFEDIEKKTLQDKSRSESLMGDYARIILGADPDDFKWERLGWKDSLHPTTLLHSVQALAVIEHRRYGKHEARGGGRYLPMRYSYGIVSGAWAAKDCREVQRQGRRGVELLEERTGFKTSLTEIRKFIS